MKTKESKILKVCALYEKLGNRSNILPEPRKRN